MTALVLAALAALAAQTPTVTIDDFAYKPATLTVRAGTTVRFVNRDGEAHTVTGPGGVFDSGGLDTAGVWTHRFDKPGRYRYFCALHPYMKGTIVVIAPAGSGR